MRGVNKAIILGRVGNDPETKVLQSGLVANFSVATDESYQDKSTGQKVERVEWHRISAFGKLAEIIGQYVKKGSKVYVEGKIHTRKWQDQSGQDRYSTEIKAETLQMLDSKQEGEQPRQGQDCRQSDDAKAYRQASGGTAKRSGPPEPPPFDDVPF